MIENYRPRLNLYETQSAIGFIKQTFQFELSRRLHLMRATAPLFVDPATGLNDDLSGIERPVSFDIPGVPGVESAQVVHSLAKWKRQALGEYGFQPDTGLWTDMNAIRRDEEPDALHSIYVDQWDWEKVITRENRNSEYLKLIVRAIVRAICDTNDRLHVRFPQLRVDLDRDVSFITSQALEDLYPDLKTGSEREKAYLKEHKTACIMQIGKHTSQSFNTTNIDFAVFMRKRRSTDFKYDSVCTCKGFCYCDNEISKLYELRHSRTSQILKMLKINTEIF